MRSLAGALVIALLTASCTSGSSDPTSSTSTVPFPPPPSLETDRVLAELDLEALASPVSRLRQLDFLKPVEVRIVEDAAYRTRVNELTAAPLDLTPDLQSSWLRLLGLMPEGTNIYSATTRFLQTTVAMYDKVQKHWERR